MSRPRNILKSVPVTHPEWLNDAIDSAQNTLRLAREDRLPDSIKGWMIKTSLMRIFRALYGSDQATLTGLTESIAASKALSLEVRYHMDTFPEGCPDKNCPMCDVSGGESHA